MGSVKPKAFLGCGEGVLTIGENSHINYRCFFDLGANISIGKGCNISYNVTFVNSSHNIGTEDGRAGTNVAFPIVVEDGCWIGANVTIMPNVTIGKGCIIGANSLVTKSTVPNGLYMGQPARRIKDLK